jgi:hypothetical protein
MSLDLNGPGQDQHQDTDGSASERGFHVVRHVEDWRCSADFELDYNDIPVRPLPQF